MLFCVFCYYFELLTLGVESGWGGMLRVWTCLMFWFWFGVDYAAFIRSVDIVDFGCDFLISIVVCVDVYYVLKLIVL